MDCCQLEQECPPTVKKEILLDEADRKSPDQDPSDNGPHGRDGLNNQHNQDPSSSPHSRAGPGSDRSPELRDSCSGRERRAPGVTLTPHQKSLSNNASRLSDESSATTVSVEINEALHFATI